MAGARHILLVNNVQVVDHHFDLYITVYMMIFVDMMMMTCFADMIVMMQLIGQQMIFVLEKYSTAMCQLRW